MNWLSELSLIWMISAGVVVMVFSIVIALSNSTHSKSNNNVSGTDTPDKSIELAKITVYDPNGKELKTYMADADSIDTYSEGELDFETNEGERIFLLTGNNLIEVKYL